MTLASGYFLGPYEILVPLGAGGMGEVYRARDSRLGREVAVKVLSERIAGTPEALGRFERESRAAAALSHPNIVIVYDCGSANGVSYSVSELLEGESLGDRLRRASLHWRQALEIAIAVADGLACAHAKGIVHRDIKPDNIFLTSSGVVKILDFGLARLDGVSASSNGATPDGTLAIGSPTGGISVDTMPGALIGTIHYMSPEQARGRTADARSDIFSLGIVLYEMLTGRRPFLRETAAETMVAIMNDPPAPIERYNRDVPREFESLIMHCMEKNPTDRFQTAQDLAFNLKAIRSQADSYGRSASNAGAGQSAAAGGSMGAGGSGGGGTTPPPDPKALFENLKRDFSHLKDLGTEKGSEAIRKAAERLKSEEWLGKAGPKVAEHLETIGDEIRWKAERKRRRRARSHKNRGLAVWAIIAVVIYVATRGFVHPRSWVFHIPLTIGLIITLLVLFSGRERRAERRAGRDGGYDYDRDDPPRDSSWDREGRRKETAGASSWSAERSREGPPESASWSAERSRSESAGPSTWSAERSREERAGPSSWSAEQSRPERAPERAPDRPDQRPRRDDTEYRRGRGRHDEEISDRSLLIAAVLCFFFGWAGAHRFYLGKIGTGFAQLFTVGGFGIWFLVDLIIILLGGFHDGQGRRLADW